jgi:hypothetical protein
MTDNKQYSFQYPIINNYDLNINNVDIIESKHNETIQNTNTYVRTYYTVTYDFAKNVNKPLHIITKFLDIFYCNISNNTIEYGININKVSSNEYLLKQLFQDLYQKISIKLMLIYPTLTQHNISFIKCDIFNDKKDTNIFMFELKSYDDIINCPIHVHKSKAKGGGIITIKSQKYTDFKNSIHKELPLFKYPNAYCKIFENNDNKKKIYYKGKFIISFSVKVYKNVDTVNNILDNNVLKAIIKVNINEMEVKYNMNYVNSFMDKSMETIKIKNTLTKITI